MIVQDIFTCGWVRRQTRKLTGRQDGDRSVAGGRIEQGKGIIIKSRIQRRRSGSTRGRPGHGTIVPASGFWRRGIMGGLQGAPSVVVWRRCGA